MSKLKLFKLKYKRNCKRIANYKHNNISRIQPYLYFVMFIMMCIQFICYIFISYKKIDDATYLEYVGEFIAIYSLIECLFFEKYTTYLEAAILWHSSLKTYYKFLNNKGSLFKLLKSKNNRFIDKLIISNIEVIGIILSEVGIVLNRSSSVNSNLNIVNAVIISIVLLISLIVFIRDIKSYLLYDIVKLKNNKLIRNNFPGSFKKEERFEKRKVKKVDIKSREQFFALCLIYAFHWFDIKHTLGKDFNYMTDNMF